MKSRINSLGVFLMILMALVLSACGGGGGGGSAPPPTDDPGTSSAVIAGFDFTLQQGDFWEYAWVYHQSTTSADGNSGESDVGTFRITLGIPETIDGHTAFPLIISGKRTDPGGFTYAQNLTHVALDGNQIMVSKDGATLQAIFDASTGLATGGFFAPLGLVSAVAATSVAVDNQFVKGTTAYRVGGSTDDPLCDNILGETICGDDASSITQYEYYKAGLGPISYYLLTTNTYTGGGYTTYHRTERILGIVDSSLSASDGFNPADAPWRIKSEIPIADFDAWFAGGAALNGKIYIVYNGELHIYDPATDSWTQGADMTTPGIYYPVALVNDDHLKVFQGGDIFTYDSANDQWSHLSNQFTFGAGLQQYAVAKLQYNGVDAYGVFLDSDSVNINFYDLAYGSTVTWSSYPGAGESYRSQAIYNEKIYIFGGSHYTTGFTYYDQCYTVDPWASTASWLSLSPMPTARSGASAVVSGDKIYVIGGNGDASGNAPYAVEAYDPQTDSWTVKSSSLLGFGFGLAFEVGGKIYLIDDGPGYVLEYNPATDQ